MGQRILRPVMLLLMIGLFVCGGMAAQAQAEDPSSLTLGQPILVTLNAGETRTFTYTPAQTATVTFQSIGQVAAPTLSVFESGELLAEEANAAGEATIVLNALLRPVEPYRVDLGSVNGAGGTLVLVVLNETPVPALTLTPDVPLSGQVDATAPTALFRFTALGEPSYLYIDSSGLVENGAAFQITNSESGHVVGLLSPETTGGRFRLPAGTASFEITASFSDLTSADSFTICYTAISDGGCGAGQSGADVVATVAASVVETPVVACTVTPQLGSGANIRYSASTASPLVGLLPGGQSADVAGISPDNTFYNIQFANLNGWVALSVVNASGNCNDLSAVQPPPFSLPPTATPVPPTATTVPPTAVPPTATPSGPCLITVTSEFLVYTTPNAIPDFIQDQVAPGYQLIPVGRLADNSWWRTNYFNAWVQTSNFGSRAQVSGDCSGLPVVSP